MKAAIVFGLVLVAACGGSEKASSRLFITTTDFATSANVATFDLVREDSDVSAEALGDQDTTAALLGRTPILLEHGLGNILLQSTDDPFETMVTISVDEEGAVDPYASNPQAVISAASNKAYVLPAKINDVIVINPESGAVSSRIDLSSFLVAGDTDGSVDMLDGVIVDDRLYVALGNYWFDDAFTMHLEGSVLVAIDLSTDVVVDLDPATDGNQGIDLAGDNPWRGMTYDAATGRLRISSTGVYGEADGQVESVDLETGTSEIVLAESSLGGELGRYVQVSDDHAFVMSDMDVRTYDPITGELGDVAISNVSDMMLVGDELFAWGADGLRRYDATTGDLTGGPWTFGPNAISSVAVIP